MDLELKKKLPKVLIEISQAIAAENGVTYLVGGWVRDVILGRESKDYDLEIYGITDEQLDKILKPFGKPSHVGKAFGITLLVVDGVQYDFAFPRTEMKTQEGHKGFEVKTDPFMTFKEAASRRDFTINAMGMKLPEFTLEDPWNGSEDLETLTLRHVGPAFGEDPLRALRAVQFAARFELDVVDETVEICKEQDLSELSVERIEEEFRKLFLKSRQPVKGLYWLKEMNLLRFFPEWSKLNWPLVLHRIGELTPLLKDCDDELVEMQYYTMISLGLDAEETLSLLERLTRLKRNLKESPLRVEATETLCSLNGGFEGLTDGEFRRLALRFPFVELIPLLEVVTSSTEQSEIIKNRALELGVYHKVPKPLLNGRDLIPLGVKPGPALGEWIAKAFESQLDGELKSIEESIEWVKAQI
jgi:tRNA nucleotidyltransferase (CCA-adding enzyme)